MLALLLAASSAHAGLDWHSLWRTADQRAEQLMRQGDARAAASTYADPRHKAYAELQAGDYASAARDFAGLDDSDAHYNRGNALAHAGDLAAALKAYDAALARDPNNKDARHNRELVERALRSQPHPPPQDQAKKSQQGKGDAKNDEKNDAKSGSKSDQRQGGKNASTSGSPKEQSSAGAPSKDAEKQGAGQGAQQQGKQGESPSGADHGNAAQAANGSAKDAAQSRGQGASKAADDKQQVARDAAAALARAPGSQSDDKSGDQGNDKGAGAANAGAAQAKADGATTAQRERQLSQEQWLERIPDDPGGLLRRKLLIEHLMRQQRGQP